MACFISMELVESRVKIGITCCITICRKLDIVIFFISQEYSN